ncbi:MAG: ABC transporter permease [Theionarchaea archaeon]|nr:ABC transporter permease [Theionarchaea archaeon]
MGIFRTARAELIKDFRNSFFTNYMIFFNLVLPFGLGLTYYFIYLPFRQDILNVQGYEISLLNFTLSGQIIYLLFINMILIGGYFTRERLQGTLETIFLTPCNRTAILMGGSIAGLVNYCWFILGMVSIAVVLRIKPQIQSFPAVFFSVILAVTSTVVVGMLFQAFFVSSRRGNMWANLLQEPVVFVSGIVFPLQYAPLFIQLIASAVPLSYSVLALRASVFAGATVPDLLEVFILLTGITIFYALVTVYFMRVVDVKLRRDGTLQLF